MAENVKQADALPGRDHDGAAASILKMVLAGLAIAYALFHIVQSAYLIVPTGATKVIHLCGGAVVAALAFGIARGRYARIAALALALLAAVCLFYILGELNAYAGSRAFRPNDADLVIAGVLLFTALVVCAMQWGFALPILAICTLLYAYFGALLPGELFWHGGIGLKRLLGYTSIPFFNGMLGGLTELSASTVILFLIFGAALTHTGGADLIMRLASRVGRRQRSGPAQMAVVSSGLMGMISGSTVANVVSTGALTIPMMRKHGYSANFAGAVESVASMGGQITPPIMGLAAFLIVTLAGVPYLDVIAAAALPAAIYYGYLITAVNLRAAAAGLEPVTDGDDKLANIKLQLKDITVGIGIAVLVWLLVSGMPPGYAAMLATITLLALWALAVLAENAYAPAKALSIVFTGVRNTLRDGAISGAQIAVIVAVCGILVDLVAVTGFAQKLSFQMLSIAGDSRILLLVLAAVSCLVFGLGLPTSAAYIVVALLGAPALVEAGVPLLAAHFFVLYYANVSSVTPPVALAALVASKISKGSFFGTTFVAMRLALPGFVLPFLFVAHPQIMLIDTTIWTALIYALVALAGLVALIAAMEGYLFGPLNPVLRGILVLCAAGTFAPGWIGSAAGVALFVAVILWQVFLSPSAKAEASN